MGGAARNVSILMTLLMVFICVEQGLSIKCWVCRSDFDPKCADPFDNSTIGFSDCSQLDPLEHLPGVGKPTMCRKIRQKVAGVWKYFRSCAYLGEPGIEGDERFCLMRTGSYNVFMEYCTCNSKDGCNGGHNVRGAWYIPIIVGFSIIGSARIFL
ncbi:uncharacterized protein [Venturia canescens]|uniref:uncharacterized protein n=1 Tax=Venturia canescens TaxID=32260 RepID=UPI001C9BDB25|nr:uncharacterized protein LOC122415737 [Venturia canescens]